MAVSIASITAGAPGVTLQWVDANAQTLDVGRTDVAGFIGVTSRGPFNLAVKIESTRQFETVFGPHADAGVLAFAVDGFFANGGRRCWVVRAGDGSRAVAATGAIDLADGSRVELQASSTGAWGNDIAVEPVRERDGSLAFEASLGDRTQRVALPPIDKVAASKSLSGIPFADLPELSPEQLVVARRVSGPANAAVTPGPIYLAGGDDMLAAIGASHFAQGPNAPSAIDALDRIDGISFIAAPDLVLYARSNDALLAAQTALLARCQARRDRIALLDTPLGQQADALAWRDLLPDTSFGALYYPWLDVSDPLAGLGMLRTMPPSGHVAGVFARSDRLRGVHKAAANEVLEGVWDTSQPIDGAAHGELNSHHVNAIRALPGRGIVLLGARTLSRDPRWAFVNVRRLFAMIETAIDEQMQWLVFEPNSPALWRDVERSARGMLERLWGAGMLDGATAAEAYSVQCDAANNPAASTDEGRMVCDIGIQPPYPAEFVIVRIGVMRSGIRVEEKGAQDG